MFKILAVPRPEYAGANDYASSGAYLIERVSDRDEAEMLRAKYEDQMRRSVVRKDYTAIVLDEAEKYPTGRYEILSVPKEEGVKPPTYRITLVLERDIETMLSKYRDTLGEAGLDGERVLVVAQEVL